MHSDPTPAPDQPDGDAATDERVEIDDPFEVPPEVEQAWDDEEAQEGPAPTG